MKLDPKNQSEKCMRNLVGKVHVCGAILQKEPRGMIGDRTTVACPGHGSCDLTYVLAYNVSMPLQVSKRFHESEMRISAALGRPCRIACRVDLDTVDKSFMTKFQDLSMHTRFDFTIFKLMISLL